MMLVSLDLARKHVRADDDDDDLLEQYLAAAQQTVIDYLNRPVYLSLADLQADITGKEPILVNAAIRAAVLLITGNLYKQRETIITGVSVQEIPLAMDLLRPHRRINGV